MAPADKTIRGAAPALRFARLGWIGTGRTKDTDSRRAGRWRRNPILTLHELRAGTRRLTDPSCSRIAGPIDELASGLRHRSSARFRATCFRCAMSDALARAAGRDGFGLRTASR